MPELGFASRRSVSTRRVPTDRGAIATDAAGGSTLDHHSEVAFVAERVVTRTQQRDGIDAGNPVRLERRLVMRITPFGAQTTTRHHATVVTLLGRTANPAGNGGSAATDINGTRLSVEHDPGDDTIALQPPQSAAGQQLAVVQLHGAVTVTGPRLEIRRHCEVGALIPTAQLAALVQVTERTRVGATLAFRALRLSGKVRRQRHEVFQRAIDAGAEFGIEEPVHHPPTRRRAQIQVAPIAILERSFVTYYVAPVRDRDPSFARRQVPDLVDQERLPSANPST